jgi:putative peptidoglycan lipid II flippase
MSDFKTQSKMGRHAFSTVASASFGMATSVLLDAIVIALFGMGWQTDAYFIAVTIPMVIITILMLQATRVVQPIFIRRSKTEGEAAGWDYINLITTSGTAIVAGVCFAGALLSPMLIRLQTAGSLPDERLLATRLSILIFVILPLYFPIVVMRAVLNGLGIFALPGAMKFFENTFKILFVLLLWPKLGVQALALGMFAGALFQIASFYFVLRRKGFHFRPVLRLHHPDMVQAYSLVGFQLAGQACGTGVEIINNALSSMLGAGNVTALRLATRIIEALAGLLPASIVLAAMPAVAASVANGDPDATKKHLQNGIYLLLLVTIPLSVWLGLMHTPIIAFLYERAKFSAADTVVVANLLMLMIPYVLLGRVLGLLELPFFAQQDTRTPLLGSIVQAAIYVALSFGAVSVLGIYALPVARSLAGLSGPLLLGYLLTRRMGKLGFGAIRDSATRICGASVVMAVFIFLGNWLALMLPWRGFAAKVIMLAIPSGTGFAALVISLFALGVFDRAILDRNALFLGRWFSWIIGLVNYPRKSP